MTTYVKNNFYGGKAVKTSVITDYKKCALGKYLLINRHSHLQLKYKNIEQENIQYFIWGVPSTITWIISNKYKNRRANYRNTQAAAE